jgi:hypothetical protein
VSQPGTLSYLELGWILTPDGQPHPVQDVDFKVILLKKDYILKRLFVPPLSLMYEYGYRPIKAKHFR